MTKEHKGYIYILTNPSFEEYVKIGYAHDVEKRIQQLNRSETIPYAFRAYAKYEVDSELTDMKDRKYDHDLAALEAERNAIKQEMETLKTVSKDNVERTFKLFS